MAREGDGRKKQNDLLHPLLLGGDERVMISGKHLFEEGGKTSLRFLSGMVKSFAFLSFLRLYI